MLLLVMLKGLAANFSLRITSVARGRWAAHKAVTLRRRTYVELSALDDRTLHDIGLNRSMVMSAATEVAQTRLAAKKQSGAMLSHQSPLSVGQVASTG